MPQARGAALDALRERLGTASHVYVSPGDPTDQRFGASVALSADGGRALVGGPRSGVFGAGIAYAFVRSGTTWLAPATLIPALAGNGGHIGSSVALSADGLRALVGAEAEETGTVTVYVLPAP